MENFKTSVLDHYTVTGDYRQDLLDLLYREALEGRLFAEAECLIGAGAFEDCFLTQEEELAHYHEFLAHFEKATGKKFLGDLDTPPEGEDLSPDPGLSTEAYRNALRKTVRDAEKGCKEAADWVGYWPGEKADAMRLTYAEALAFTAGQNAWLGWLEGKLAFDTLDEAGAFLKAAETFYAKEFLGFAEDLREDRAWLEEQEEN